MIDELLLQGNNEIPFVGAQVTIHNPTMNEIGMISETSFQTGLNFINFSKENLSFQDKSDLEGLSDFDVFMSIMNNNEPAEYKQDTLKLFDILFPEYDVEFSDVIQLKNKQTMAISCINNDNFVEFKNILNSMFDMHDVGNKSSYNPADLRAAKIAEKLRKGKQRVAESKGESVDKVSIFAQYVSILSVGECKDKNSLMQYTAYQLKDEFKRWQLKVNFDINIKAKLAGATNVEEAENWMDDIHKASQ